MAGTAKKVYAAPAVVKHTVILRTLGFPGGFGEPLNNYEADGE
jgi:hypothetical protein